MFIIESIISGMMAIADVIWGWPILILTSFVAVYMTVRLRFFQFRHFGLIMKETFGKVFDKGSGEGNINPFKAACTALASTLGVGNIAGVSVAIATGGPGAVFWMWFIAMLGLIVKFSEVTLAVAYPGKRPRYGRMARRISLVCQKRSGKEMEMAVPHLDNYPGPGHDGRPGCTV